MMRYRLERADIPRKRMVRILGVLRKLSGNVGLQIHELFDLDPDNPENWKD